MINLDAFEYLSNESGLTVCVTYPPFSPGIDLDKRVAAVWSAACEQNTNLYEDPTLAVKEFTATEVVCQTMPYRYFFAQSANRDLAREINICLLAVSGICVTNGKYLVGKRSEKSTQFPGYFEFIPSGSVIPSLTLPDGSIDFIGNFYRELFEEIGLSSDAVTKVRVDGMLFDRSERTLDICIYYEVLKKAIDTLAVFVKSEEYSEVDWLDREELLTLAQRSYGLIPASEAILLLSE